MVLLCLTCLTSPPNSKLCPAVPAARNNEAFQLPRTSLPKKVPDATEAPVQFSKVTVLSASCKKLPPVERPPPWRTRQTRRDAVRGSNMFLQMLQPNLKISLKT